MRNTAASLPCCLPMPSRLQASLDRCATLEPCTWCAGRASESRLCVQISEACTMTAGGCRWAAMQRACEAAEQGSRAMQTDDWLSTDSWKGVRLMRQGCAAEHAESGPALAAKRCCTSQANKC
jgi:hypothetical protein